MPTILRWQFFFFFFNLKPVFVNAVSINSSLLIIILLLSNDYYIFIGHIIGILLQFYFTIIHKTFQAFKVNINETNSSDGA